jgi:hypothetical protein
MLAQWSHSDRRNLELPMPILEQLGWNGTEFRSSSIELYEREVQDEVLVYYWTGINPLFSALSISFLDVRQDLLAISLDELGLIWT